MGMAVNTESGTLISSVLVCIYFVSTAIWSPLTPKITLASSKTL